MARSSVTSDDGLSDAESTSSLSVDVASVLGVKGPLRFQPHGCTQRAHIILRRVVDSDDDEEPRVVRFSFFAQKRIDVKPGKEILLAITTDDEQLKDTPLVFVGDYKDSSSTEDEDLPAVEEEPVCVVPPKMRRGWTRVHTIPRPPAVEKPSIGIQAVPECNSANVQAEPLCASVSIQKDLEYTGVSVQATEAIFTSSYPTPTPPALPAAPIPVFPPVDDDLRDHEEEMEISDCEDRRSLSPMDLDSPTSSATSSPITSTFPSIANSSQTSIPEHSVSPVVKQLPSPEPSQLVPLSTDEPGPPSRISSPPHSPKSSRSCSVPLAQEKPWLPSPPASQEPTVPPSTASTTTSGEGRDSNAASVPVRKPALKIGIMDMFVKAKLPTGPSDLLASIPTGVSKHVTGEAPSAKPSTDQTQPTALPSAGPTTDKPSPAPPSPRVNAVASSSKTTLQSKPIPTGPRHFNRSVNSDPLQNPLGIRPSTPNFVKAEKPPPSGPKALSANIAKKTIVVDGKWSASRATGATSTTPNPSNSSTATTKSARRKRKKQKAGNAPTTANQGTAEAPLPPSLPPPRPPLPTEPGTVTASTSKWKPVNAPNWAESSASSNVNEIGPSKRSTSPYLHWSPSSPPLGQHASSGQSTAPLPVSSIPEPVSSRATGSWNYRGGPPEDVCPRWGSPERFEPTPVPSASTLVRTASSTAPWSGPASSGWSSPERFEALSLPTASTSVRAISPSSSRTRSPPPAAPAIPLALSLHGLRPLPAAQAPPMTHPLPAKPQPTSPTCQRGLKRGRPLSPDPPERSAESQNKKRHRIKWPVVRSNLTKYLHGDGEPNAHNISFSADGNYFVLSCSDRTVRVWSNRSRSEIARLSHNAPVVNTVWLADDAGVIALTDDGLVHKWARVADNRWEWSKVLDAGSDYRSEQDPICFAYARDKIAVSFPRMGVKVWTWNRGLCVWQSQRSILRQNVTAIKFIADGMALIGGTRDGALWYCEIPNGTLRAYAFLRTKIVSLDMSPQGTHVLVGQDNGSAVLVALRMSENKGHVEQIYTCKDQQPQLQQPHSSRCPPGFEFGAVFATQSQAILLGSIESCVLVWDKKKAAIVYGLEHDQGDCIQAVAVSFRFHGLGWSKATC
ncbi:hypothetical protein CC2G_006174 [Coprinopsis cinerea AmutBmut pab1-1]|nr:hypothetical protein CC2G_006174 [Coprinopsis cinerea AmutBmut pab1-1]